jgi:hypothetical protein
MDEIISKIKMKVGARICGANLWPLAFDLKKKT